MRDGEIPRRSMVPNHGGGNTTRFNTGFVLTMMLVLVAILVLVWILSGTHEGPSGNAPASETPQMSR